MVYYRVLNIATKTCKHLSTIIELKTICILSKKSRNKIIKNIKHMCNNAVLIMYIHQTITSQIQQFLKCDLIANGTIFCTQTKRAFMVE